MAHILERRKTLRRKDEETLRENEEKYRSILESIEEGYYEVDLAGNLTFFNDSIYRVIGYPRVELMGMNYRQYTNQENAKKLFQAFNEVYRTGKANKACAYEIIKKDGTKSYVTASISLRKDLSRKKIGFRGIIWDITERKLSEETLRQSEEKYRNLLDNASDAILLVNEARDLLEVNRRAEELLGYTRKELLGINIAKIHPEEERERIINGFGEINKKGLGIVNNTAVLRKDGTTVSVDISGSVIEYSGNKVIQEIFRDITERKQIEKELYKSEEKYRHILENMEEGYFEIDMVGNFTFVNNAECKNLGYSREELIGMNYRQYQDEATARKTYQVFKSMYKTRESSKIINSEIIRKDGTKVIHETSISLIRDEKGKQIGFRGVSRDITEREQTEEALRKNREALIKKNQENEESKRNVQLALERLGAAYEKLKTTQSKIFQQEKLASIGQLAAGVAHEINNPMAFIASNLGTLDKYIRRLEDFIQAQSEAIKSIKATDAIEKLEKKRKELKLDYTIDDIDILLKESRDGSERVQKIVHGLARFSRVDDAEYKDTNINDCIESSINVVWDELKHKVILYKDYGNLSPTKCYPQKLNQVFINLLINAIHAIEKKGEIKIKTWEKDGSIWITISDTGCGIPQTNQSKIFEPFFTTKEVGNGTGLGLSISYEIMQRHKGELTFQSEKGKGTTFTIRMPIV
jgi:two-component system NtrC family sensor kinase